MRHEQHRAAEQERGRLDDDGDQERDRDHEQHEQDPQPAPARGLTHWPGPLAHTAFLGCTVVRLIGAGPLRRSGGVTTQERFGVQAERPGVHAQVGAGDTGTKLFVRPVVLEVDQQPARPGDVRHSQADQTRLRSQFPDVEPVDFEQGLRQTVAWFRTLG